MSVRVLCSFVERKRIVEKWHKYAPDLWWGDPLDVRFYLCSRLKKLRDVRILDVGCGAGIILSEIPDDGNVKVGVDLSKKFLDVAKLLNKNSDFVLADMHHLPFRDGVFNFVIVACSFSVFDCAVPERLAKTSQPQRLVEQVYRSLVKRGTLLLTTPNREHRVYEKSNKADRQTLNRLLIPYFIFKTFGYNPLPRPVDTFVRFSCSSRLRGLNILSGTLTAKILAFISKAQLFRGKGKFFFVVGEKR